MQPPPPPASSSPSKPTTPPLSSGLKRRQALQARINERPSFGKSYSKEPNLSAVHRPIPKLGNKNSLNEAQSSPHLTGPCSGFGWWLSGLPCLLIILAYGGTGSMLCGAVGTILWHVLDLAGPSWGGFALAVWWITLFSIGISVAGASGELITHSFSLILLPAAQIIWLFLLGIWGTLQYKWMAEESFALVEFLSEILCTLTPLLAPPLLTWGALALQVVNVGHGSLLLALINHVIVRQSIFTPTSVVVGSVELKIIAYTSVVLPLTVHAAVHYQMLIGTSSSALSALLAITEGSLDQARTDILWEMAILGSGGLVSLFYLDIEVRKRNHGLVWSSPPPPSSTSSVEEVTIASWLQSWTRVGNMPQLLSVTALLYSLDIRLIVFIQQYIEVWWGGMGLFVAAGLTVAGFSIWSLVEDEEKSVVALHALTSTAMFLVTHIFGVAWLLRPMCIAACMSLCEFLTSQQLAWFLVSVITLGVALRNWVNSRIGFLSSSVPLPLLEWLPFLGGSHGEPLSRLLLCIVVLSMISLILPAAVWSHQDKNIVALYLTCHHAILLLLESLLRNVEDPYPTLFLCLTAAAHIGLAWRLTGSGAAAGWSRWIAASLALAKLVTLTEFTALPQESLFPTALLFAVMSSPMLHPSRQSVAQLKSTTNNSENVAPLPAVLGMFLACLACFASVWCMPSTIYPALTSIMNSPLSSVRALCASAILSCLFLAVLLARHFPHRLRMRRLSTATVAALSVLFWLNPKVFSWATSKNTVMNSFQRSSGSIALSLAMVMFVFLLFGAIPFRKLGTFGRMFVGALLGACFGYSVSTSYFPVSTDLLLAFTPLYLSFLGAAACLLSHKVKGAHGLAQLNAASSLFGGALYCGSLCCGVIMWIVSDIAHFSNPILYSAQQKSLAIVLSMSQILLAINLRLGLLSMETGHRVGLKRSTRDAGRRNTQAASYHEQEDEFMTLFAGNCATVIGWAGATYYTYLVRAGSADTLRSLMLELPITLLLTLLRGDGGLLQGLHADNRFAIPTAAALFKLVSLPLYSLLIRGAPFLVTSSFADSAKQTLPILKGVDIIRVTKARALRELSFWTATSLTSPLLESLLLVSTLPMHAFVLAYMWNQRQLFTSSTAIMLFPLNFIALVLSKQLGTQLLGLFGLILGLWQQSDSRTLSRALQRRL